MCARSATFAVSFRIVLCYDQPWDWCAEVDWMCDRSPWPNLSLFIFAQTEYNEIRTRWALSRPLIGKRLAREKSNIDTRIAAQTSDQVRIFVYCDAADRSETLVVNREKRKRECFAPASPMWVKVALRPVWTRRRTFAASPRKTRPRA